MFQNQFMRSCLQRIATGPELSKDLSLEEARDAMALILAGEIHPVQAAVFLVALRMKRETEDENRGVLDALRQATLAIQADVDDLVEFAEPYNGCVRHLPVAPFLPAVLAACGVPAVTHGVELLGPKFGLTARPVLAAAGVPVDLTPSEAARRISDPAVGWAYVDQRYGTPALFALTELRNLIVKRPCLATLEKMTGPVRARGRNHLIVGYVHKAYPGLITLLARHAGYHSALVVRGIEGGIMPALKGSVPYIRYGASGPDEEGGLDPAALGIHANQRFAPLPAAYCEGGKLAAKVSLAEVAQVAADGGLAALNGKPGPERDGLILGAALILWHLGRAADLGAAAQRVAEVLDNGAALRHLRG